MKLLDEHFEIAVETQDGITKLRSLILTLAMQGRLVPQEPDDEPAGVLLNEIGLRKGKQLQEGDVTPRAHSVVHEPQKAPYAAPSGWAWTPIGQIANVVRGVTYQKNQAETNARVGLIELLRANNIGETINYDEVVYVPEDLVREQQVLRPGDILIALSSGSPHLVGKAAQFNDEKVCTFGAFCGVIRSFYAPLNAFLNAYSKSPVYRKQTQKEGRGIGIQNLGKEALENVVMCLPPLAEQRRIVTKLDQLMSLCDKLEAERDERDNKRLTVHAAAMNRLLTAPDKPAFNKSWNFITDHFDELYSVTENVSELKKGILQLAVMGKLVPQDPNDQPASELLKEIEAEKKRLVKEGKIKPQKPLPLIKEEEIPYQLPKGWEWVRLGEVVHLISGQHIEVADYNVTADGFPYLTGPADFGPKYPNPTKWTTKPKVFAYRGDILVTVKGAGVGKLNMCHLEKVVISRQLMAVRSLGVDRDYLRYFLESLFDVLQSEMKGIGIPGIGREHILGKIFGLPPLPEQKRLVTKMEQLTSLCDSLRGDLSSAVEKRAAILDAVLARV